MAKRVGRIAARASRRRLAGAAVALVAAAAVALLSPWGGGGPGVAQRALAAAGDGPVVHALVRTSAGERVELRTGRSSRVASDCEFWHDRERGVVRSVSSYDGDVVGDYLGHAGAFAPGAMATWYRDALERGDAREVGDGVLRGRRVLWLALESDTQEIRAAVDPDSFELVALRALDGGEVVYELDVLVFETVSRREAALDDVDAEPLPREAGGVSMSAATDAVAGVPTLADAVDRFGAPAVWPGREFGGTRLSWADTQTMEAQADGSEPLRWRSLTLRYGPPGSEPAVLEVEQAHGKDASKGWRALGRIAPRPGSWTSSVRAADGHRATRSRSGRGGCRRTGCTCS